MNQLVKDFERNMKSVDEMLEKIPGKAGVRIGIVAGVVAMSSPLAAGIALGTAGVYGVYKLAKYAQESDDGVVIDAEVVAPPETDV